MQKYLCYALAAAALGTLIGLAIGFVAFPKIIWSAYAMMYYMPSIATCLLYTSMNVSLVDTKEKG